MPDDSAKTEEAFAGRLTTWIKLGALIAILAGAVIFVMTRQGSTREQANDLINYFRTSFSPSMQRLLYVLFYVAGTVFLLPGTVLSFAGAILFGTWQGTLFTWIGATIGSTLAFLWAKALGRGFVERLFKGDRFEKFEKSIEKNGFQGLLIIRLIPLFPFNGINFGSGLTKIRLLDYVMATAIGIIPGTFVYQYLFATVGQRALEEGIRFSDLKDPNLLLAVSLFVVFLVMVKVVSKRLKSGEKES